MKKEFGNMRNTFHSRYVRLYGACDREGFYDDVIEAAWDTSLGVHALIWVSLHATCMPISSLFESQFGFDGTNQWVDRRDRLFRTLHSNPKAKFVTRVVQFGSEPLFDHVLPPGELAAQVLSAKKSLSSLNIPVTVSELAYGYQSNGGAQSVLDAIDSINIHMLPFFSSKASTGKVSPPDLIRIATQPHTGANAWPQVFTDLNWFINNGRGKKMYLDEVRFVSRRIVS